MVIFSNDGWLLQRKNGTVKYVCRKGRNQRNVILKERDKMAIRIRRGNQVDFEELKPILATFLTENYTFAMEKGNMPQRGFRDVMSETSYRLVLIAD